jgi:glycosyltransferase involved in cell wall biosynthesis
MTENHDIPLVTAIITTYNRPTHLERAVRSVLAQSYDRIELIVVDDHSETPASETLASVDLSSLSSSRIIRHEDNRGANAARNTGVEAAIGEYIAFLDDDDQWLPKKLARQVDAFDSADIGLVYCGITRVLPDDSWIELPPVVEGDMTRALLCENVVGSLSVVMVRTTVAHSIPFDERFPCWADLEWYINLSTETQLKRIPEPLVRYECDSPDRLSRDFEKTNRGRQLFVSQFESLAAGYGRLFARKMRGWAAYRAGKSAFHNGMYDRARTLFCIAITAYPFESAFGKLLLASVGGHRTHKLARVVTQLGN